MFPDSLKVGLGIIDDRHEEFWQLLEMLKAEKNDEVFMLMFSRLIEHTKEHFEADMLRINSSNLYEHKVEHKKALEEMDYFYSKGQKGLMPFAKNYINDRAENWFRQHLLNMDSDLARELKQISL
jgi:hemerythrin-like metal-binding protein